MKSTYRVNSGKYAGQIGVMIGRVCDCSNNDIKLRFDDGSESWFVFRDVTRENICARCRGTKVIEVPHKHQMYCYKEVYDFKYGTRDQLVCTDQFDKVACPECKND